MPLPLPAADKTAPSDILVPDCCNAGVILRVLAAVNGVALTVVMLSSEGRAKGLTRFVEVSSMLEPICLASLVLLCGLRRVATHLLPWQQRLSCALIPSLWTALVLRVLLRLDWFGTSFPNLTMFKAMLVAALFGGTVQHYFELRNRAYSPALGEARLQALQARIRPHFLFNSLNAVLSLIRSEPRRAETALEDLSELFRVLMRDGRERTSLEDEIRLCKQYLSIEKIRLGARLQIEWDTSAIHADALHEALLPSLLLQPLLENAVYYGVEPSAEASLIRIVLRRARDTIHISVINPYHGAASVSLGNHLALDNIRNRLLLLHDVEAELTTAITGGYFEVRLHFPYSKANR